MEFVIVHFREIRGVLIDGCESGQTGETLRTNAGLHTFSLDGASDFTPPEQDVDIADTTEIKPQEVTFA